MASAEQTIVELKAISEDAIAQAQKRHRSRPSRQPRQQQPGVDGACQSASASRRRQRQPGLEERQPRHKSRRESARLQHCRAHEQVIACMVTTIANVSRAERPVECWPSPARSPGRTPQRLPEQAAASRRSPYSASSSRTRPPGRPSGSSAPPPGHTALRSWLAAARRRAPGRRATGAAGWPCGPAVRTGSRSDTRAPGRSSGFPTAPPHRPVQRPCYRRRRGAVDGASPEFRHRVRRSAHRALLALLRVMADDRDEHVGDAGVRTSPSAASAAGRVVEEQNGAAEERSFVDRPSDRAVATWSGSARSSR